MRPKREQVKGIFVMAVAVIVQLVLLTGFVLWGAANADVQWEWETTLTVLPTKENIAVDIQTYTPKRSRTATLLQDMGLAAHSRLNDLYLRDYLTAVSVAFVKEHGAGTQLQHEVLTSRGDLFCYRLYDTTKNASWQVGVSMPSGQTPQVSVLRTLEVKP